MAFLLTSILKLDILLIYVDILSGNTNILRYLSKAKGLTKCIAQGLFAAKQSQVVLVFGQMNETRGARMRVRHGCVA